MPKYQVLTKPIGSIGVDKSQCTNETVIFGKIEVSNEDFTIFPYNPSFFPDVHCRGGWGLAGHKTYLKGSYYATLILLKVYRCPNLIAN